MLAAQSREIEIPIAKPRMVMGKISESINHTSGPAKVCMQNMKVSIAPRMR